VGIRKTHDITVLFACIGRRVSLLEYFRRAGRSMQIKAALYGTDVSPLSPAWCLCDKAFLVRPVHHRDYIRQLLDIVAGYKVRLIVPTVDLDLGILARNKHRFESLGCKVLVSDPKVIEICQDKRKTFRFLTKHGFETPLTVSPSRMLTDPEKTGPPIPVCSSPGMDTPVATTSWSRTAGNWPSLAGVSPARSANP